MKILRARYRSGGEMVAHYLPTLSGGGIFYPTREAIDPGRAVVLEIRFPELRNKMMLRGTIAWRRSGRHRDKVRAGLAIEFHSTETARRDFILAVAQGKAATRSVRRHRRLPVSLPAAWRVVAGREAFPARIEDIAPGGAFLTRGDAPEEQLTTERGTEIVVDVVPPGAVAPLAISARIAWVRQGGGGLGVEFLWRDAGGARRIKELVRRLETAA